MAYLGRKGATAPLNSADIPDGSVSAVKVASDVATQAEIDLKANIASPTFTGTIGGGTIGSGVVFPDGVCRSMGFLTREQTSVNANSGLFGGTGDQITPFTNIRDGFISSNWTNPILTLSSY